jgi:putative transposase
MDRQYPYLVADAHYKYVQEDGQLESERLLLIKGINQDGYREILSVVVAPTEEEVSRNEVFSDLLARDLDTKSVRCVGSDEHPNLRNAMRRYLPRAIWQRCQMHYQRNALGKVLRKTHEEIHAVLRYVFPDQDLRPRPES